MHRLNFNVYNLTPIDECVSVFLLMSGWSQLEYWFAYSSVWDYIGIAPETRVTSGLSSLNSVEMFAWGDNSQSRDTIMLDWSRGWRVEEFEMTVWEVTGREMWVVLIYWRMCELKSCHLSANNCVNCHTIESFIYFVKLWLISVTFLWPGYCWIEQCHSHTSVCIIVELSSVCDFCVIYD